MPKEPQRCNILLTSKTEFRQYLNCTEERLDKIYVPLNLPGLCVNGRWLGTTKEIDDWLNSISHSPIRHSLQRQITVGNGEDVE